VVSVAESHIGLVQAGDRRGPREVIDVAVADLHVGLSIRSGLDHSHVATLAEVADAWPPLVVQRITLTVIDGAHRLAAAKKLGLRSVSAVIFDGNEDEAEICGIRSNIDHGLPLSLFDRKRAARNLLARHVDWSDRSIAETCGLAAKTVARVRASVASSDVNGTPTGPNTCRVGKDGTLRRLSPAIAQNEVIQAITSDPNASLRTIAKGAGVSPETVRRIRLRLNDKPPFTPVAPPAAQPTDFSTKLRPPGAALWSTDSACLSTSEGRAFAAWFDRHSVGLDESLTYAEHVPLNRIYEIVDETRHRIATWDRFAAALTCRTKPGG
jgi:hypothetical protein